MNIKNTQKVMDELKEIYDKMPKEPYTNYDRIINMDINELAEELYIHLGGCHACACFLLVKNTTLGSIIV